MLINGKNPFLKQSIRQKKAPEWKSNFETYAIKFEEILERLIIKELFDENNINKLKEELKIEKSYNIEFLDINMYVDILKKLLINRNTYHISKILSNKELFFIIVFTVVLIRTGFRFIDVEYLTLKAIGAKKASNWLNKYYGSTINKHKDLIVGIYKDDDINKDTLTIGKESDLILLVENILTKKIVFFLNQEKKIDIKPIYFNKIGNVSFVNKKK